MAENLKEESLTQELRELNRSYQLLSDVNQIINRTNDQQRLLQEIVELAVKKGGYSLAWIGKIEADALKLLHYYSADKSPFENLDLTIFNQTGLYNRTYLEEEMRRINTERQLPISIIMGDLNNLILNWQNCL